MSARYVLRRLAQLVPAVGAILVLMFLLIHLAPGDPVLALAGESGDAAYYDAMRERFGLDQPLPQRLVSYLGRVLQGDLGTSYFSGRPATAVVLQRLPATLLLGTAAMFISSLVGITMGVLAARRPHGWADLTLRGVALTGYAVPSFWLAQVAVLLLAFGTGLFPVQGMTSARTQLTGLARTLDILHHLALPALVLATTQIALNTRLVRTGLLEASTTEYVRTARAKGLREGTVLYHALRNVLLPLTTVIGGRLGMFFAGAVLVELVFGWPGIGRLLLSAASARDYPILLAIFLLVSLAVILVNLIVDLIYGRLDPRIEYD